MCGSYAAASTSSKRVNVGRMLYYEACNWVVDAIPIHYLEYRKKEVCISRLHDLTYSHHKRKV